MIAVILAACLSLLLTLIGTPLFIRMLVKRGYGQFIRDDGPETHATKRGTPTMGGVVIIGAALISYFASHLLTGSLPTPSGVLRALARASSSAPTSSEETLVSPSPLDAVANALTIPPIHVDHVAEAVCIAADGAREDVRGVYGVREMRELIGWTQKGEQAGGAVHG